MMAGLCTRWLGLCRASGPRWGSAWTPQPRPGPGTRPDNLGPMPCPRPVPGLTRAKNRPRIGWHEIVDGAFIWTSSHDQRLRPLATALLRSWLRSPVGPEPQSTWSARSEVRTNDLDGQRNCLETQYGHGVWLSAGQRPRLIRRSSYVKAVTERSWLICGADGIAGRWGRQRAL